MSDTKYDTSNNRAKHSGIEAFNTKEPFETQNDDAKQNNTKSFISISIIIGQILAIFLASSGICATFLARSGINLPLAQNAPHYTMILFIFGSFYLTKYFLNRYMRAATSEIILIEPIPKGRAWIIMCCYGVADFSAFWAILAAYAYTNLTSIQLLDCVGIPVSMLLSCIILQHRYSWTHYVGAVLCIVGACVMVGADVLTKNSGLAVNSSNNLTDVRPDHDVILGDLLAISGAVLYGLSSVLQEYVTLHYDPKTYLTFLGLIAAPLCMIFTAALEHKQIHQMITTGTIDGISIPINTLFFYLGYAASMFALDVIMAFTMQRLQAVFVNLSLLTADFYSLFAGLWLFNFTFHYLYFISFGVVIIGAVTFSIRPVMRKLISKDV